MRILYLDIDTLRPDHLGCYGYHRHTSPNIDALASGAAIFENVYASDVPCLPSRTALLTGRFGIHNGVVNHGGTDADPVIDGADRQFWSSLQVTSFPTRLKRAGLTTVSISSFAQRHSAFHWYAGFDEAYNVGKYGLETADEVHAIASDWLQRRGKLDNWFLHVHMWDPHTPYRAPTAYGNPYQDELLPAWFTEEQRNAHWSGCGPHSAQECNGFAPKPDMLQAFPRQPQEIPDMDAARAMFDGYDLGVWMADEYVGRLLNQLADQGLDDVVVILSSDHGEALGELNVYGDHQCADYTTTRIPMIVHWPDKFPNKRFKALHYHLDVFATVLDVLGEKVPSKWDGASFAATLSGEPADVGREYLVVSQGAWACQRGVRFGDWHYLHTRHDAYHLYPDEMLFNVVNDPHQTDNRIEVEAVAAESARQNLQAWLEENLATAARGRDPFDNVLAEGGPFHVRGQLSDYAERLRNTDRAHLAEQLIAKWGG